AVKLTRVAKCAYFVDKKDSDIIEEILDGHGLTSDVDPTAVGARAVVQFDSTDWDFILCRAEANGRVVAVSDGSVAVKAPDAAQDPPLGVASGATLLERDVERDARLQDEGIRAKAWSAADQALAQSEAAEPADTRNGNVDAGTLAGVAAGGTQVLRH